MDEGYTNPAVILIVGKITTDGRNVMHEFYQRRRLQLTGDGIQMAEYRVSEFVTDPSAAGLIADMRRAGIPTPARTTPSWTGFQAVKPGWRRQATHRLGDD